MTNVLAELFAPEDLQPKAGQFLETDYVPHQPTIRFAIAKREEDGTFYDASKHDIPEASHFHIEITGRKGTKNKFGWSVRCKVKPVDGSAPWIGYLSLGQESKTTGPAPVVKSVDPCPLDKVPIVTITSLSKAKELLDDMAAAINSAELLKEPKTIFVVQNDVNGSTFGQRAACIIRFNLKRD
jgi:hypothetical protein